MGLYSTSDLSLSLLCIFSAPALLPFLSYFALTLPFVTRCPTSAPCVLLGDLMHTTCSVSDDFMAPRVCRSCSLGIKAIGPSPLKHYKPVKIPFIGHAFLYRFVLWPHTLPHACKSMHTQLRTNCTTDSVLSSRPKSYPDLSSSPYVGLPRLNSKHHLPLSACLTLWI